jgi:hypothetical protein
VIDAIDVAEKNVSELEKGFRLYFIVRKLRPGEIDGPVRNGLDARHTIFSLLIDLGDIHAIANLRE